MKMVFMGTPDFAVGALEALIGAGHEISLVVTQPDRPRGRSGQPAFSPVKECALAHGLKVFQPVRIKTPEAVDRLKEAEAQVYVVAAFGQILSQEILDIPPLGCLNIHASLLPKYRGASPIQHAILEGEKESGVTIMQMDAGLDTGDMLYKKKVDIKRGDTFATLHDKLMAAGGEAIVEALAALEEGKLVPEKQDSSKSTYAPLIQKSMGELRFEEPAIQLENQVRGMNPWPSAYTFYKGKQLKIWEAEALLEESDSEGNPLEGNPLKGREPGTVLEAGGDRLLVAAGGGCLWIHSLQLEGKRRMSTHDFLLGVRLLPGERLGR